MINQSDYISNLKMPEKIIKRKKKKVPFENKVINFRSKSLFEFIFKYCCRINSTLIHICLEIYICLQLLSTLTYNLEKIEQKKEE